MFLLLLSWQMRASIIFDSASMGGGMENVFVAQPSTGTLPGDFH